MPCQTGRGKRRRLEWQLGSLAACARAPLGRGGGTGRARRPLVGGREVERAAATATATARALPQPSARAPSHRRGSAWSGRTCWGQSGLRPLLPAALSPVPPCSSRQLTPGPLSSLFSERAPLPPPSTRAPGSLPLPCSHLPQKVRATCLNFAPMVAGLGRAQRLKSRLAPDVLCVFGQSRILLWPSFPSASLRDRRLVDLSNWCGGVRIRAVYGLLGKFIKGWVWVILFSYFGHFPRIFFFQ